VEIAVSTAPRYVPRYTRDDHAAWAGDWELLDGVAVAMTPSPFGRHAAGLARLAAILWNAIDAARCRATVLAEIDWVVSDDTVVRPDVVVVCGPAPERHVEHPPALIAEILSAATRTRDLTVKRDLYEAQGVRWYLVIDPDEGQSMLMRLGESGRYESSRAVGLRDVELCADCMLSLDFGK
jgi:Uma2 family endonuclease